MSLFPQVRTKPVTIDVDPIASTRLKIAWIDDNVFFDFKKGKCAILSQSDFTEFYRALVEITKAKQPVKKSASKWSIEYNDNFGSDAIVYDALIRIDSTAFFTDIEYFTINVGMIGACMP